MDFSTVLPKIVCFRIDSGSEVSCILSLRNSLGSRNFIRWENSSPSDANLNAESID